MEIKEILERVVDKNDLTFDEAYFMLDKIMKGEIEPSQAAAYLVALRMKGESVDEIYASAKAMRDNGSVVSDLEESLEIVGTGGDKAFTFNISSVSTFVISANNILVCKHGNRSVSSKCGAADLYEALGVNIKTSKEKALEIAKKINLVFLFAQVYHTSMKNVGPIRKSLGLRTIFNILGPLTNPAHAKYMLIGVYDKTLCRPLAEVLDKLGAKNALVVHGMDGLDEVTLTDKTYVCELRNHKIKEYFFDPEEYGFKLCAKEDLVGGDPNVNKEICLDILNGKKGAKRDVVVLNSALAMYIRSNDLSIKDAIKMAEGVLDNGEAMKQALKYISLSNEQ